MGNYSYLLQQSEEYFEAHNKNNLDFIELNPLPSCLICFSIEKQSSRQFQDFWNWFLNEHLAETYTAYTTYYFDQAHFENNFEERNNTTETPFETKEENYQTASVFDFLSSKSDSSTQTVTPEPMANDLIQQNILIALQGIQTALSNNKFKVAITPDIATLEYYQSIYTHCKQRFNIPDGIEIVKKSVYQYIENHINNYLFGNYNISEVKSNLYNNLVHYSQLRTEDLNSETLATYFQELNFNIIEYCEEKYPVQSKYSFDFESETKTSNKGKQRLKQYSRTTPNTPTLQKTPVKHLQTPEQRTSVKLPLSITLFPISFVQPQTPNLPLNHFSRPKDFQSPRNPTQQQEPISTSANIIDYLQENKSNYSESLESEGTESEPEEITENKEEMTTAYIAKIPEFTGEDNDTSPQEWLDKVQKAGDANGWIAAKMLKAIPYFLQGTAGEWFENLEEPFENWQAFKDAFL
ncbi:hypothetical protein G9A89_022836 [Geosiphon pyriformis]|nr:hypothetical protein G9A89_022836 [Geosiphon pyriformis]